MNFEDWLAQFELHNARVLKAAAGAIDDLGEQILADSKELCPVSATNPTIIGKRGKPIKNPLYNGHPSALRDSGIAEPIEVDGTSIVKRIKYTTDYAAAVHERLAPRHGAELQAAHPQAHIPNLKGQAKFLAVPMLKRRDSAAQFIAKRIEEASRGT